LLLLGADDRSATFSLKMQDESLLPFCSFSIMYVHVDSRCRFRASETDITRDTRDAWLPNADLLANAQVWRRFVVSFALKENVAIRIEQRCGEAL
jgi:hypothetical protein